jgi:hypothetical protein
MDNLELTLTPLEQAELEAKSFAWGLYSALVIYKLIQETSASEVATAAATYWTPTSGSMLSKTAA